MDYSTFAAYILDIAEYIARDDVNNLADISEHEYADVLAMTGRRYIMRGESQYSARMVADAFIDSVNVEEFRAKLEL